MSIVTMKSAFLTMVQCRSLGTGPKTALSIDRDFYPSENVKVLSSTLVMLSRAIAPVFNVAVSANIVTGSCFTRLTNNWASKNLKLVFESSSVFIMYNEGRAFVTLMYKLTPGRRTSGTLNGSICKCPKPATLYWH